MSSWPELPTNRRVIVFDLEYTAWQGSQARGWSAPGEHREIVQIGAVKLDPARGWTELDCYCRLVRPQINPQLSEYFIALTGITQAQVDAGGVAYSTALAEFAAFAEGLDLWSNGPDGEVIAENCRLTGTEPLLSGRSVDVRPLLGARLNKAGEQLDSYRLAEQFAEAGRAHDALADARGVAGALRHVLGR